MVFFKLVLVIDFLKVGKLVKFLVINMIVLDLESFDVIEMKWVWSGLFIFEIEEMWFLYGVFRDVFCVIIVDKNVV